MKTNPAAVVAGLAALVLSATGVRAQYAYKTLSLPLPSTQVFLGIDGASFVGTYRDEIGQHGFVYNGSAYIRLDDPSSGGGFTGTWATGISGTNIVGYYLDTNHEAHGFLYDGTTWTTLDHPGATNTYAQGLSGANIVGSFTDTNGVSNGFFYDGASWTTLDYPGAKGTSAQGISAANIVGSFTNASGTSHGFLYNGITWTELDAPTSAATYAEGISGSNIVGYYSDSAGTNHGFFYNGGNWRTLDDPLASDGTDARGISGSDVVGNWHASYISPYGPGGVKAISHGFLYAAGRYQTLDDPQASLPTSTLAAGIDGTNVVGYFIWAEYPYALGVSPQPWEGFLYNGVAWSSFANPLEITNAGLNLDVAPILPTPMGTVATGISGTNIVGYYYDTNVTAHGFVYGGGDWTTLDDPVAAETDLPNYVRGTFPNGISGSNIVGYFVDTNSAAHGFLYNGGSWITLDDPLAGDAADQGTFAAGTSGSNVVGYYVDASARHGFFYDGSNYQTLDAPQTSGVSYSDSGTYATGISGTNIVGFYFDTNGVAHGFLYNGGNWTILDDPYAGSLMGMGTFAQGISGSNIVGYFVNRMDEGYPVATGFLATPAPNLAIAASTNGVTLSWPYNPPATWVLQENPTLTTTNWTLVPGVSNNGTNNSVTVTPSAQALFFRLMLQ